MLGLIDDVTARFFFSSLTVQRCVSGNRFWDPGATHPSMPSRRFELYECVTLRVFS